MKDTFWQLIEKFPIIGLILNTLILLVLPATLIIFLVKSIRRKNKKGIIVFSLLNLCYLIFIAHIVLSISALVRVNKEFHNEVQQVQHYKIQQIENPQDGMDLDKGDFPIVKINEGLVIDGEGDKTFKFYNRPEYKIDAFVFYIGGFEVPVNYDFLPGHFYEINFENIQKSYKIKSVGVFYKKGEGEKSEIWTDDMEGGINSLFIKK